MYNFVLKVNTVKTYWIWAHPLWNTLYSVGRRDSCDWLCEKRVEQTGGAVVRHPSILRRNERNSKTVHASGPKIEHVSLMAKERGNNWNKWSGTVKEHQDQWRKDVPSVSKHFAIAWILFSEIQFVKYIFLVNSYNKTK